MDIIVRQIMNRDVQTIASDVPLPALEEAFVNEGVSGFPVVDDGQLVGIISRSDVVRQLFLEHRAAETTSDFYFYADGFHEEPLVTFDQIADRVGERIERLRVKDVMSRTVFKASPDQPMRQVAQTMTDNRIHRVLVTEQNRLVGIVSSIDLVRLVANGRLTPKV